jgi:hypothetical protein
MTQEEFKTKLSEAFETNIFMENRKCHSINELLYVLEHDSRFNSEDFNISILNRGTYWTSIPCLGAFVTVQVRSIWFKDADVEFETEEWEDGQKFNCITIYED